MIGIILVVGISVVCKKKNSPVVELMSTQGCLERKRIEDLLFGEV